MEEWAPDPGLVSGFEVWASGRNSWPWHECLGPEYRSEPQIVVWGLGWLCGPGEMSGSWDRDLDPHWRVGVWDGHLGWYQGLGTQ